MEIREKEYHPKLEEQIQQKTRHPEFTLSHYTKLKMSINIDLIATLFGTYLSDLNVHQGFWDAIDDWLRQEPTKWYNDNQERTQRIWYKDCTVKHCIYEDGILNREKTLTNIAQAYGLSYSEICELNPDTFRTFTENDTLKVHADLNKHSSAAAKQRAQFAKNLFPRETYRQRESRKNRLHACQVYLSLFERLEIAVERFHQEMLFPHDVLNAILSHAVTPFNSQQLDKLHDKVLSINPNDHQKMLDVLNDFLERYRPTQFKLACVMYPFLAEFHWIIGLIAEKNADFNFYSLRIGNYLIPMEAVIEEAKALTATNPKYLEKIRRFEERIKEEKAKQKTQHGSTFDGGQLSPLKSEASSAVQTPSSSNSQLTPVSSHSRITIPDSQINSDSDSQLSDDD